MNSIEKITQRIEADARAEAGGILADARRRAEALCASYEARARREAREILDRGEKEAAAREARLAAAARAEARKRMLGAKQELLNRAFEGALARLTALPDGAYAALLADLAARAAVTGREAVIFSPGDRARVGAQAVAAANKKLGRGGLTLSGETRPLRGGCILRGGAVEINCAFEALARQVREEAAAEAAKILFAEALRTGREG